MNSITQSICLPIMFEALWDTQNNMTRVLAFKELLI